MEKFNPFFYAHGAEKITSQPVIVNGYKVWLLASCLDCYSSPFRSVVIQTPEKRAKLYPVRFQGPIPDFAALDLTTVETPNGHVVCMSPENFWKIEETVVCIPRSVNEWKSRLGVFSDIVALHHLSIIPRLSATIFKKTTSIDMYLDPLKCQYGTDSIAEIFRSTLFSLAIFGYCATDDPKEQKELMYANKMLDLREDIHAFGQIRHAIRRYNETCENVDPNKMEYLTGHSYRLLMKSVDLVTQILSQLGFSVIGDHSLIHAISEFQKQHGLEETGICNAETLRVLWKYALSKSTDPQDLLKQAGFVKVRKNERQVRSISEKQKTENLELMRSRVNEMLAGIPDYRMAELWLENQIRGKMGDVAMRCMALNERIESMKQRMESASKVVDKVTTENEKYNKFTTEWRTTMTNLGKEYSGTHERYERNKVHISFQRKINNWLTVGGFIFLIAVFLKAFRF